MSAELDRETRDLLIGLRDATTRALAPPFELLGPQPGFAFDVLEPRAMSIFFHWPEDVARRSTRGCLGAVLAVVSTPQETPESDFVSVARAALIYEDGASATAASDVLLPWLVEKVSTENSVTEMDPTRGPSLGDQRLWAFTGKHDDEGRLRADAGWLRGRVLGCVVAFGPRDVTDACLAGAMDFDRAMRDLA